MNDREMVHLTKYANMLLDRHDRSHRDVRIVPWKGARPQRVSEKNCPRVGCVRRRSAIKRIFEDQ